MAYKHQRGRYFDKKIDEVKVEEPFPRSENAVSQNPVVPAKGKKKWFSEDKKERAIQRKEINKKRQQKKRRIIIRNLSFKVNEEELKKVLSKFGNVVEVTIPKQKDGRVKGFAFAQFDNFHSSLQAIKNLNFKEIYGRKVAIDYAISKDKYDHAVSSRKVSRPNKASADSDEDEDSDSETPAIKQESEDDSDGESESHTEDTNVTEKDKKVALLLKEFGFKAESDEEQENDPDGPESQSSSDDEEFESDEESKNIQSKNLKGVSPKKEKSCVEDEANDRSSSKDVHEGKTVFVRNISFETVEDDLKDAMSELGAVTYCLLCIDPVTEMPKGSAFVKFEQKEDADKLIAKSESENGLYLDGRKLYCSLALSRKEVQDKGQGAVKEKKDKRNLNLLKEGLIMSNSEEAKNMSPSDLAKRAKLEFMKKQKLKNLNFFVSPTRLCVHNIPQHFSDSNLRKLFQKMSGPGAVLTEARIMKDFKKLNTKGEPKSRGYGFITFRRHEDALAALQKLDNHPSAFHPQNRPIVEFAIENHLVLLSKQRRQEKSKFKSNKAKSENNERSMEKEKITPYLGKGRNNKVHNANSSTEISKSIASPGQGRQNRKRRRTKQGKISGNETNSRDKSLGTSTSNANQKNKKLKTEECASKSPKLEKKKNKGKGVKTENKMNFQEFRNLVDTHKNKLMKTM